MDDGEFVAMFLVHRHFLLRVAGSLVGPDDAEDAVQEAFVRAWRHRAAFDGRAPGGWLATITRNHCLSTFRRPCLATVVLDRLPGHPDRLPGPEDAALAGELSDALAAALATLSDPQRDAVLLCLRDGVANTDAARALGIRKQTIGTRILRGRLNLQRVLTC